VQAKLLLQRMDDRFAGDQLFKIHANSIVQALS